MNAIAAVCRNRGIGKNNDLLFNIPEDKKFFRRMTTGKTVIMGRKTYQSLPGGKALPDRRNIVLSGNSDLAPADAEVCRSIDELRALIKDIPPEDIFVIGGGEIYSALIDECDRAYITLIESSPEADRFFPDIFSGGWTLSESSEEKQHNDIRFRFMTYVRASAAE